MDNQRFAMHRNILLSVKCCYTVNQLPPYLTADTNKYLQFQHKVEPVLSQWINWIHNECDDDVNAVWLMPGYAWLWRRKNIICDPKLLFIKESLCRIEKALLLAIPVAALWNAASKLLIESNLMPWYTHDKVLFHSLLGKSWIYFQKPFTVWFSHCL